MSGGGGCCLIAGTQVSTPTGYRNIEDMVVGETLISYDVKSGKATTAEIKVAVHLIREGYFVLTTNDGRTVGMTDDHPFYDPVAAEWISHNPSLTVKGYEELNDVHYLDVDSHLQLEDGSVVKVISLQYVEGAVPVYTFIIDAPHTYYANSYLTHNGHQDGGGGGGTTIDYYTYGGAGGEGEGYIGGAALIGPVAGGAPGENAGGGGAGGYLGSAGAPGVTGNMSIEGSGGSAGYAVELNGFSLTWEGAGPIYGPVG